MINTEFAEEIDDIQFHVYKNLFPFARSGSKRDIRVPISRSFAEHLKLHGFNSKFKPGDEFADSFILPTTRLIEERKSCSFARFEIKIHERKMMDKFQPRPVLGIRFIRIDNIE